MITANKFLGWVAAARPGERFVYHCGFLDKDIEREAFDYAGGKARSRRIWQTREEDYACYESLKVLLVQKRVDHEKFQYIAVRRGR